MSRRWLRYARRDAAVLGLIYAALFIGRFLSARDGLAHWEELHSPTAAALLASGHSWTRLLSLQYMPFCGGCTLETIAILPTTILLGPSLAIWKCIPLLFGLGILGLTMSIAHRIGGGSAARFAGLCLVFAPGFYQDNRMVAWGNHFEVASIILGLVWLWMRWMDRGGRRLAGVFGVCLGLGFWFCYSSGFVGPVLVMLWMRAKDRERWRTEGPWLLAGAVLGLVPWMAIQSIFQVTGVTNGESVLALYGQGPTEIVSTFTEIPLRISSIFGPVFWRSSFGPDGAVGGTVVALAAAAGTVAMAVCTRRWWQRPDPAGQMAAAVGGLLGAFTVLYIFLSPIQDAIRDEALLSIDLRYLNPLVPLWAIAIGVWGTSQPRHGGRAWQRLSIPAWLIPGLAAAWMGVQISDMSTRTLHLTALRPVAMGGRTLGLSGGVTDLGAEMARIHGSPGSRRIASFSVGRAVAQLLLHDDVDLGALEETLDDMSKVDAQDVLTGIAHGLRGGAGWASGRALRGPGPRLASTLHALSAETGGFLAAETIRFQQPDLSPLVGRLMKGSDPMVALEWAEAHPAFASALARDAGRGLAWRTLDRYRDSAQAVRLSASLVGGTALPFRRAVMHGVGEVFGSQFGHISGRRGALQQSLPRSLRAPFSEGYTLSARRTFWAPAIAPGSAE
jgi:hypothetical protein